MVTKERLDELLEELKADVARMKPTPLSMALATDVFWAIDPLPVDDFAESVDRMAKKHRKSLERLGEESHD